MSRAKKAQLYLEVNLTEDELKIHGKAMADALNKIVDCEAKKKSFDDQMKSEISGHEATLARCSRLVSSGKEYRQVDCDIVYDWDNKTKKFVRLDTGEIAKDDIISESELQEKMEIAA